MRSGLTKVEKLQFWLGFEPTLILKNQKLSKNDICRLQDSIFGPLAYKSSTNPLSYAASLSMLTNQGEDIFANSLLMIQ